MTPQIEQHLTAYGKMKRKDIMLNNFLGGIAWGFGTVIGASIVAAAIIYLLKSTGVFYFIQQFALPTI
jgi:hypothetical protein